jgi:hypothetical protein
MRPIARITLLIVLSVIFGRQAQAEQIRPGYVLCESGGQLRWFVDLKDLNELWRAHRQPWKVPVNLDGGVHYKFQAEKSFQQRWCQPSSAVAQRQVVVVESCDSSLPYPNGGCRKIRLGSTQWYTFGDALQK